MKKHKLIVVSMLVFGVASASDFNAPDLGKLSPEKVKVYKAGAIPWVVDGKAMLPIVWKGEKSDTTYNGWSHYTRRYTRGSIWSKDPAAFGKLMFVE